MIDIAEEKLTYVGVFGTAGAAGATAGATAGTTGGDTGFGAATTLSPSSSGPCAETKALKRSVNGLPLQAVRAYIPERNGEDD